jgi:hypothetical protein
MSDIEPGRVPLEGSLLLSAVSILVPVLSPAAAGCAVLARRAENPSWRAALVAALWCGVLGLAVRGFFGAGLLP